MISIPKFDKRTCNDICFSK